MLSQLSCLSLHVRFAVVFLRHLLRCLYPPFSLLSLPSWLPLTIPLSSSSLLPPLSSFCDSLAAVSVVARCRRSGEWEERWRMRLMICATLDLMLARKVLNHSQWRLSRANCHKMWVRCLSCCWVTAMRLKQGKVQVLMSAFPFGCQIWKRLVKKPVRGICVLKRLPVSAKCRSSRKLLMILIQAAWFGGKGILWRMIQFVIEIV